MKGWRAVAVVAGTTVLLALALLGLVLNMTAKAGEDLNRASEFVYLCNPLVTGTVGGFLIYRRPRHPAGWLMGIAVLAFVIDSLSKGVLHHASQGDPWTTGPRPWAAWFDNWTWIWFVTALTITLLRFPDGRLPGRRWRLVEIYILSVAAGATVACALEPVSSDIGGMHTVAAGHSLPVPAGWLVGVLIVGLLTSFVLGVVAMIVRRRRAVGAERAQLRWVLWSGGLIVATTVGSGLAAWFFHAVGVHEPLLYTGLDVSTELAALSPALAIMIAVTREGLFEIDRVISRTLAYTVVTALLAGFYAAAVTTASLLLPDKLGSLPVAGATLAVAALFVPVRRRVTRTVDRHFNRSRYDADLVVAAFADRVRGAGSEHVTHEDLLTAVRDALQPAHASVWLMPSGRSS